MIVDSVASDHSIDEELIPRLRKNMRDYKKLKEPNIIMTNGNKKVFATATGTSWGYIIDQSGKRVPVHISAMFVPGLGRNVFSSLKAVQSGISTILEKGNPTGSSTAALRFRSTNTQRTRVYALTTYFFAPWAAQLIRHQRLL